MKKENCNCGCFEENIGEVVKGKSDFKKKTSMECDCDIIHEKEVSKAKVDVLDEDVLLLIADFYKALSDSTRVKIINLLEKHELCVCDISAILNMTKSTISHQLKNLREINLIKSRKQGKEVWYSLADKHVEEVFEVSLEHIMEIIDEQKSED